jgi:uncharacterized FlaG/YvyC family protein
MGFYDNRDNNELLNGPHYNTQVKPVNPTYQKSAIAPHEDAGEEKKHHEKHKNPYHNSKEEKAKHFHELTIAAEELQKRLEKSDAPFRFCVYLDEAGEIIIDKVKLDSNGKIIEEETLDITHEEFRKWITDFYDGEGLLFDKTA